MGNSSAIDISLANIYHCWELFRHGKKPSRDISEFQYYLEPNLLSLARDLQANRYQHGPYRHFEVHDNKKRVVAVAQVRDRVVHRLLYEYLVPLWDNHFAYDVWSCRPNKGLIGAVERTAVHMQSYYDGWLWRGDVAKFFDSIAHEVLRTCLRRRVFDPRAHFLLDNVIQSYIHNKESASYGTGLPIGNLTSQIFANVYLNEFDRFVLQNLKPHAYVRYGDDFILWGSTKQQAESWAQTGAAFLLNDLSLSLHKTNYAVQPVRNKLHFLGLDFWPPGHRLDKRMRMRIPTQTNDKNLASYQSLIERYGSKNARKEFVWRQLLDGS